MQNRYDVIIAGAGPASLSCADALKNSGLNILLIEKNKEIGPKICAGGLTPLAGNYDLPPGKVRSFPQQTLILNGRRYELTLNFPLRTVDRIDLAANQLGKIMNAEHIEILSGTRIHKIDRNRIVTDKGAFTFRKLVGADGSCSVVRKSLGLPVKFGFGLYYKVPKVTDDFVVSFDPARLRAGCLWMFPHHHFTNIGVGYNPRFVRTEVAKSVLKEFLVANGHSPPTRGLRGAPLSYLYCGCNFDPIFLAGDAAGLVSKATGEGISYAIESGREIARIILDREYEMEGMKKVLVMKRRQEFFWNILEHLPSLQSLMMHYFFTYLQSAKLRSFFGNYQKTAGY